MVSIERLESPLHVGDLGPVPPVRQVDEIVLAGAAQSVQPAVRRPGLLQYSLLWRECVRKENLVYRKRRDDCLPVLTLLVRLRHEILAGAAGRPQLVLGPDAAAVVAHPLHPVLPAGQIIMWYTADILRSFISMLLLQT